MSQNKPVEIIKSGQTKTNTVISDRILLGAQATIKNNLIAQSIFYIADDDKHQKILFNPEFKFQSETGERFSADDEDSLRKWSIKPADLGPLWAALKDKFSKGQWKKLTLPGKRTYAQVLQEGSSVPEIHAPKKAKNTSQGAAAAEDGKNSTTSADEGKLSGSSKAEADKTKDPQLLKGAVGEENVAKPVRVEFFEAKRFDHWPRTEGLSHKRIQSTLDFLEDRKRNGVVPGLDVLIPYHVNDAVIMTLQRLSQANPREWKNTYSQNPEELLRILLAAFPVQGLQKRYGGGTHGY